MRAVVQRVVEASVVVDGETIGSVEQGLLIYLGVETTDSEDDAKYIVNKIRHLRIFPDHTKPMNKDVSESGGAVLVVSAFTTAGDARRGRRPSFDAAANGDMAEPLYERVCEMIAETGLNVATGSFGADMAVKSVNDGPVCILLDSKRTF